MIIYRPNASPLEENSLFRKLIIYRPNASPLRLLTPAIVRVLRKLKIKFSSQSILLYDRKI
ncbi:hypothetical protein H5968_23290 [Sphaerospermopsis sp. LEGE 00249]|uniref:hypothetical protein n=1 Tax=Sphaerospermopsis sp. LEGE 00249 TaxID=1380707 RepID=UPI00164DE569|nr:hypothetical protein [Sphaerospermopsis sp. LEGE 00249]MBC5797991.1 hypothetical protein [Sphaerospermopsis sp. LEGE 00249]